MIFLFLSIFVGYIGVITRFDVVKWKARVWFVIIPTIFYAVIALAAIAYLS